MSIDFSKHPAYVDPQGWSAAAQIMQAAGRDQCGDARLRLDASISRTRALVRALHLMVKDFATPNMQDVCAMIDMVRDTVEGMGEDPLQFVDGFEISVNRAIYQNLKSRPAVVELAPAVPDAPAEVPDQSFAVNLAEVIEQVIAEHGDQLAATNGMEGA